MAVFVNSVFTTEMHSLVVIIVLIHYARDAVSMLGQHRRCWPNIVTAFRRDLVALIFTKNPLAFLRCQRRSPQRPPPSPPSELIIQSVITKANTALNADTRGTITTPMIEKLKSQ